VRPIVPTREDEVRFWSRVKILGPDDCWEWQGNCRGRTVQYGLFTIKSKNTPAHRVAYTLVKGEIPDGLSVCHECDNGKCCNPNHLWLGTIADNNRDRHEKGRSVFHNKLKTHCPAGHPLSGENLYVSPRGGRNCRTCARESDTAYRRRSGVPPRSEYFRECELRSKR
jgi:HNH endonuclease